MGKFAPSFLKILSLEVPADLANPRPYLTLFMKAQVRTFISLILPLLNSLAICKD